LGEPNLDTHDLGSANGTEFGEPNLDGHQIDPNFAKFGHAPFGEIKF
jgi:hypothetical protein